eukprot:438335_1
MASSARKESEVKEYFDEPSELQEKIKKLADLVRKSKHFVVYTGAGISTSCGIADYRSGLNTVLETGAGKWAKEAGILEGKLCRKDLKKRNKAKPKTSSFKAIPSPSHMALVALAKAGYLKHLVSQNTDGLHRRSGFPLNQLSELHGNGTLEKCAVCDKAYMRDFKCRNKKILPGGALGRLKYVADKISKGISNDGRYSKFIIDADKENLTITLSEAYDLVKQRKSTEAKQKRKDLLEHWGNVLEGTGCKLPRYLHFTGRYCSVKGCNGELCDTIINFGESLPEDTLERAQIESSKSDLYMVLGSSCTVEPAADMPEEVGLKWQDEVAKGKEPEHNLVICNIQKTPLHYLCSLPMHSKIDAVMIGLMRELKLEIPKWFLERYVKIEVRDEMVKMVRVSGVDRDGTPFSLFKSVILRQNGQRIRKIIDNKQHKEHEYNYMVTLAPGKDEGDEKKQSDDTEGLTVELQFGGNYEEPNVVIALDEYLNQVVEGQIVLKMVLDPASKVWNVPSPSEQMKDEDVKALWSVHGNGKDNDPN